jgi:hypothetical protein
MRILGRNALGAVLLVAAGYACGSGGAGKMVDAITDAVTRYELNGGSLAEQLFEAGPLPITPGIGIAERVPADGTRHFTLTVATENRVATEDSVAIYALMDAHDDAGQVWGANVLAFAHSDMRGGAVQGLEIDVGNLGTPGDVPVTGLNVFAIGAKPSDVAVGILNGTAAGAGGFREGIAFRSNAPGVAVTDALMRVHPGFGTVASGIDLRNATFTGLALATPGFSVDRDGVIESTSLVPGGRGPVPAIAAYVCVDPEGRLFANVAPCRPPPP